MGGLLYFIPCLGIIKEGSINIALQNRGNSLSVNNRFINNNETKKFQIKIIMFLCLILLLMTFKTLSIVYSINKTAFENRLYYIFYISIISKYILKEKIYKHQKLSLFISLIGMILLFIPVILFITKEDIFINLFNFFFLFLILYF